MKHIRTINKANLKETAKKGGCGKCQASASPHAKLPAQWQTRNVKDNI